MGGVDHWVPVDVSRCHVPTSGQLDAAPTTLGKHQTTTPPLCFICLLCFFPGWFLLRSPVDVMDLWCLQAEATLSFMAEKEKTLKDLSLTLPFFLLEVSVRA